MNPTEPTLPEFKIQYLGTHSLLIQAGDQKIVVDPHLSNSLGLLRRREELPVSPLTFHDTNTIVFTNGRLSRLDLSSLKFFKLKSTTIYAPKGLAAGIRRHFGFNVIEIDSFLKLEWGLATLRFWPVAHKAFRFRRNQSVGLNLSVAVNNKAVVCLSEQTHERSLIQEMATTHQVQLATLPGVSFQVFLPPASQRLSPNDVLALVEELNTKQTWLTGFAGFHPAWKSREAIQKEWLQKISGESATPVITPPKLGQILKLDT